MTGYVQVYTGNGKGKTTASIGLAIRAAGAGMSVYIGQFLKQGTYSEIKGLSRFDTITIEQYGMGKFVKNRPSADEIASARSGYETLCRIISSGAYDMVIIEEGNVAVTCNLITEGELLHLIDIKPEHTEIIITGRNATPAIIERADLVTEMVAVKHYYSKGISARIGIEK